MGLFGRSKKESADKVNWVKLQSSDELDRLIQTDSHQLPVVLFKHSTRCSISAMALRRMGEGWDVAAEIAIPVFLDLIRYRDLSNQIADDLGVRHESPQVLLVKDGKCIYHASHSQIDPEEIKEYL